MQVREWKSIPHEKETSGVKSGWESEVLATSLSCSEPLSPPSGHMASQWQDRGFRRSESVPQHSTVWLRRMSALWAALLPPPG